MLSPWIRFGHNLEILSIHTGASILTLILYMMMLYIFDMYNMGRVFLSRDTALRTAAAVVLAVIFSGFLFYTLPQWKYGRGIFLVQMVIVWCLLFSWRAVFYLIFSSTVDKEDVLILGAGWSGKTLCNLLESKVSPYRVVGFLDDDPEKRGKVMGSPHVLGGTDQLMEIAKLKRVKTAILAITHERTHELIRQLLKLRFHGFNILDMPTIYEKLTGRIPVNHVRDGWILFTSGFYLLSKDDLQKIKRLYDFWISSLLLLITFPIVALSALAIRIDSPGPVFFKQDRMGKGGHIFTAWKFRSMRHNAEENGAVWAEKKDLRVTRVGKWIRILRIDEIPQLFNVFRGEMSLIGPRPERPEFVKELEKQIPYYGIRHSVQPGITGWAQVNYRYGASVEDALHKLEYDLYYIKNMSLILDIKIILKTIGVVVHRLRRLHRLGQGAR